MTKSLFCEIQTEIHYSINLLEYVIPPPPAQCPKKTLVMVLACVMVLTCVMLLTRVMIIIIMLSLG